MNGALVVVVEGRGVHLLFLLSVSEIKAGDLPEINTLHKKRQNVKKQNKTKKADSV